MSQGVIQKNWFEINIPDLFDEDVLTETPGDSENQVIGRKVSESLTDLLEESDKYYVDVEFRITDVEGNKAFTEVYGMECSNEYVSRMVRKRSDRMDLVTDVETKDGREVRIKLVGSTVKNTSSRTLSKVRNALESHLEETAEELDYLNLMEKIFLDELQDELRDVADDIYPFRQLEVRKTELLE